MPNQYTLVLELSSATKFLNILISKFGSRYRQYNPWQDKGPKNHVTSVTYLVIANAAYSSEKEAAENVRRPDKAVLPPSTSSKVTRKYASKSQHTLKVSMK
jgi:hypothetical protein